VISTQIVTKSITTSGPGQATATAVCPSDTALGGGGFYVENAGTDPSQYTVFENRPISGTPASSWTASISSKVAATLTAYALCLSLETWTVSIGIITGPVVTSSHMIAHVDGHTPEKDADHIQKPATP